MSSWAWRNNGRASKAREGRSKAGALFSMDAPQNATLVSDEPPRRESLWTTDAPDEGFDVVAEEAELIEGREDEGLWTPGGFSAYPTDLDDDVIDAMLPEEDDPVVRSGGAPFGVRPSTEAAAAGEERDAEPRPGAGDRIGDPVGSPPGPSGGSPNGSEDGPRSGRGAPSADGRGHATVSGPGSATMWSPSTRNGAAFSPGPSFSANPGGTTGSGPSEPAESAGPAGGSPLFAAARAAAAAAATPTAASPSAASPSAASPSAASPSTASPSAGPSAAPAWTSGAAGGPTPTGTPAPPVVETPPAPVTEPRPSAEAPIESPTATPTMFGSAPVAPAAPAALPVLRHQPVPDEHGLFLAVARLQADAVEAAAVPLSVLGAVLLEGERVASVVTGTMLGNVAVVALTDRRVLVVNGRRWKPIVDVYPIAPGLVLRGRHDSVIAVLTVEDGRQSSSVDNIDAVAIAVELAQQAGRLIHG